MGELIEPEVFSAHQADLNNDRCIARVRELRSEHNKLFPPPTVGAADTCTHLQKEMQQIDLLTMFLLDINDMGDEPEHDPTPEPRGTQNA